MAWSFCEPDTVAGAAPWCLRPLTEAGQKFGGGVDTGSLCGRVRARHGWDIDVPVTKDRLENPECMCPECAVQLEKESLR